MLAVFFAASAAASGAAAPAGGLFAFGNNEYPQLGLTTNSGTFNPNPTPTLVTLPGEVGTVTQSRPVPVDHGHGDDGRDAHGRREV